MALSEDQKAMLRLLAQRQEGYADIAALLGISVEEVRARVADALAELERPAGNGAPAPVAPPAPSRPRPGESAPAAASQSPPSEPTPKPGEPANGKPAAAPPGAASAPGAGSAARAPASAMLSRLRGLWRRRDRRLAVALAGAAAVVVLLVLIAAGVFAGGGDGSSSGPPPATGGGQAGARRFTQAVLEPVDGGDATGLARFGRVGKTPVLQVEAMGLAPTRPGEVYNVWLYHSKKVVLRVGAVKLKEGEKGIAAAFPIPQQLLGYVASGAFDQIDISLTPEGAYRTEVARAKKEKRLPAYTGADVLRGKIAGPLVKAGG